MNKFNFYKTDGIVPLKLWNTAGDFEQGAMRQLENLSKLPFVHSHIAGMPDVHWGNGAAIGSVIATKGAIVPAAVGVDIGCGMMAYQTTLTASDLPDNLHNLRCALESVIPHGRTNGGKAGDKGAFEEGSKDGILAWKMELESEYINIVCKNPQIQAFNTVNHLGTLGTGNHFLEVCLDENDAVWVMLHSGSRGAGNKIGMYFIEKAKRELEKYFIDSFLPNKDLAYLVEKTDTFNDYIQAVAWAQKYAMKNREVMMRAALSTLAEHTKPFNIMENAVNCHHNYVERENHFRANVWVTRKGAVRARAGELGIIPGSMGTGSFIVRGLGNKESFCSCSHGAGRKMSREQAKKLISLEEHKEDMRGIEARLDEAVLDESPRAYKDINSVMEAQSDLVEIKFRLRQVLNIKG